MATLLLCAALFSRRSRRYVRRKAAGQIFRLNPYLYLQGCKPLSRNEREVFRNLHLAVSPPLNVQFQTAVSAMVTHDPILPPESIGLVRSTFNKLRVDFALYHFETERYVAVVELDDRTHDIPEQKAEDARRDRILMAAGIKDLLFTVDGSRAAHESQRTTDDRTWRRTGGRAASPSARRPDQRRSTPPVRTGGRPRWRGRTECPASED
jgi:hypothetical protein